eukprot:tig00001128_g7181.t1
MASEAQRTDAGDEPGGWPSEVFDDGEEARAESLHLVCPICLLVMRDPTSLQCSNDHALCWTCAEGVVRESGFPFQYEYQRAQLKCPVCREVVAQERIGRSAFRARLVNDLRACCPSRERGCGWRGALSTLTAHAISCSIGREEARAAAAEAELEQVRRRLEEAVKFGEEAAARRGEAERRAAAAEAELRSMWQRLAAAEKRGEEEAGRRAEAERRARALQAEAAEMDELREHLDEALRAADEAAEARLEADARAAAAEAALAESHGRQDAQQVEIQALRRQLLRASAAPGAALGPPAAPGGSGRPSLQAFLARPPPSGRVRARSEAAGGASGAAAPAQSGEDVEAMRRRLERARRAPEAQPPAAAAAGAAAGPRGAIGSSLRSSSTGAPRRRPPPAPSLSAFKPPPPATSGPAAPGTLCPLRLRPGPATDDAAGPAGFGGFGGFGLGGAPRGPPKNPFGASAPPAATPVSPAWGRGRGRGRRVLKGPTFGSPAGPVAPSAPAPPMNVRSCVRPVS